MLKCDICNGFEGIRHNTMVIANQFSLLEKHIHLCSICFNKRYKKILLALTVIEDNLIKEIMMKKKS